MLIFIVRVLYFLVCAGALATYIRQDTFDLPYYAALLLWVGLLAVTQLFTLIDVLIKRKRIEVLSSIYFGLLVGALLSYLLIQALEPVREQLKSLNVTGDATGS